MKMGRIEELLAPDERVIKKQDKVQLAVGEFGMPWGDLSLTNKRLIYLVSKGWSVGFSPGAGLGSKDLMFSIQDIKSVSKSIGYLKVKTDKEYQFAVSVWNTGSWVDSIQQAITLYPSPASQPPPIPPPPPPSQMTQPPQITKRYCPNCGNVVKPEAKFCESCGTKLQ
jgi:hypothetical protein